LRMRANTGRHATLFFLTGREPGWHSLTFPIEADGREHTYHLDLLSARDWRGTVVGLGLRPSDEPAMVTVRSLVISDTPQGPPQLEVTSFALAEALPRVGRPAQLVAWLANTGGAKAGPIDATLTLPDGVELLAGQPSEAPASLAPGEEGTLVWTIEARQPVAGEMRLEVEAADTDPATASAPLQITPPFDIAKTTYVPEPQPVRGPCEVGVYYFPGWQTASQWQPLQRFPERRPVLGWYREGDPEVADWHIKWAVEHGITFFAYDWYWSQGTRQLEQALHDGYFKARYRHLLKFCLLWANHNPPGTSSLDDCLAVTRYWIENYFRRPEHLTFDGKPVMILFSPHRLTEDLGSDGVKRAFDGMREECRNAGLKGLYLIACVGDAGGARKAAAEGYDAVTAYNWPHLGKTGEGNFAPFETLVPAYRRQWEHLIEDSPVPLWPLPVCGGWDSRPWHGENNLVRFGRTPERFRQHLLDAREVIQIRNPESERPKAILVEAWNEWGEGSYIEPHSEFGFGYLDAIRDVFTDAPQEHEDVTPGDVGLGPYDVPPPEPARTDWDFEQSDEGWANSMQLADLNVSESTLNARTAGNDPAFFGPPFQARASDFGSVVIRMKLARTDGKPFTDSAQLFWRTSRLAESEASSIRFKVEGDGQWHEYDVPVATNTRWRGMITRLRLDPCNQPGVNVAIDRVLLAK
ncbi:MAG: glycoside hydrolase family 99-like domain-containing protein, partial [Verrucomicrobiae bacterium]|nr:glycoside hydrolase family 99-like domain-containing protein [Verrucomicrobiae bacterium]